MKFPEGYVMIDHRASPGTKDVPEGKLFESAATQCAHCNSVVIMNPGRTRERAECRQCFAYVCDNCAFLMKQPGYIHISHKQLMEDYYRKLTSNG